MSPNEEITQHVANAVLHKETKVYCGKCKYRVYSPSMNQHHCKSKPLYGDTFLHPGSNYSECYEKNQNNNCEEYERQSRWRIPLW